MENITLRQPKGLAWGLSAVNIINVTLLLINVQQNSPFLPTFMPIVMVLLVASTIVGIFLQLYWKLQVHGDEIVVRGLGIKTYKFDDILYAVERGLDTKKTDIALYDKKFKPIANISTFSKKYTLFEDMLNAREVHFVNEDYFRIQRKRYRAKRRKTGGAS
ncbi:MAG: hypothetical protein FWB74_02125 [Defluviitaleaceae bacterium]|nr:hypothetical protein [Defluviitaleaceae bacterium]